MTIVVDALLMVVAILVALLIQGKRHARAERTLRDREERFHRMIDSAPVMLWTARTDTTLDYLNLNCAEFTGLPIEKLLNEGWLEAVHPEDRDDCTGIYGPAIEASKPFTMEYRVRRADGTYRWLLGSGVPKYDLDGNCTGYVGCDVDITERRNAEDVLVESRAALEVSHREIQQLAGSLLTAHEDERRHLARELHDDVTQRLARLAIDAGRMESVAGAPGGLRPLRENLVRLSEDVHAMSYRLHPSLLEDLGLVEALRAECDRVARYSELLIDVETSAVPMELHAESSLCLFRVAQEALSNAVRHAHASAVTVVLSSRNTGLQLAVRDNGTGFDPECARGHASLGLASMRERVRLVRGQFDIESMAGRGTTIMAWVPA